MFITEEPIISERMMIGSSSLMMSSMKIRTFEVNASRITTFMFVLAVAALITGLFGCDEFKRRYCV